MKFIRFCLLMALAPCSRANAGQVITIAFGDNMPPYTVPDSRSPLHLGMSVDIVREALEKSGYQVNPRFVPYARRLFLYKNGKGAQFVDGAADVIDGYVKEYQLKGFLTVPTLSYHNVVISLKSRKLNIKSIADMAPYGVLAWQGSSTILGPAYAKMATTNPKYSETADQSSQVKRLFLHRIDVVQMAEPIYVYWKNVIAQEMHGAVDTTQPVDVVTVFPPTIYSFLFKEAKVQADFDREYAKLVASGRLQQIEDYYQK